MKNKKSILLVALSAFTVVFLLYLLSLFVRLPLLPVHPEEAVDGTSAMVIAFERQWIDSLLPEVPPFILPRGLPEELIAFEAVLGQALSLADAGQVLATVRSASGAEQQVLLVYSGLPVRNPGDSLLSRPGWRVRKVRSHGRNIFMGTAGELDFAVCRYRNLTLLSRHAYLVENAVSQLDHPRTSICRDGAFRRLRQMVEARPRSVNVWWNIQHLRTAFGPMIHPRKLDATDRLASFGKWLYLQIPLSAKDTTATWRGAFYPQTGNSLTAALSRAESLPFRNCLSAIPAGLENLWWMPAPEFTPEFFEERWRKYFAPWYGHELVFAIGQPMIGDAFEQFVLMKTNGKDEAEPYIAALASKFPGSEMEPFQMFQIHHLRGDAVLGFFGTDKPFAETWFADLGTYALFSNTRSGIVRWLDNYVVGNTLARDAAFMQHLQPLPLNAQGFFHFDRSAAWQVVASWLHPDFLAGMNGNPFTMEQLSATLRRRGNAYFLDITTGVKATLERPTSVAMLWRVTLEGQLVREPFAFYHSYRNEHLLLAQDATRQLYLISSSGQIIWRKPFDELINSDIWPIDINNNGDTQLAFSTTSGIHVLNVEGEEMPGFPIRLLVPATNGLTVVDFFKSRDFSFFIACENGNVYGYDERGSPLEGWRPRDSVGIVRHPMLHFQASGMDFLVFLNEKPTLRVYRKNGQNRFPPVALEGSFSSPPSIQVLKVSTRIMACNNAGKAWVTNLSGAVFSLSLKAGSGAGTRFVFTDIAGDDRKECLALSDNTLAAYGYEGQQFRLLFNRDFEAPQHDAFSLRWKNSPKSLVGVVDAVHNQIAIVDGKGRRLPQFPLAGDTRFQVIDLTGSGKPVLITGHDNQVYAYLLARG